MGRQNVCTVHWCGPETIKLSASLNDAGMAARNDGREKKKEIEKLGLETVAHSASNPVCFSISSV
jgi:hypothetical protein